VLESYRPLGPCAARAAVYNHDVLALHSALATHHLSSRNIRAHLTPCPSRITRIQGAACCATPTVARRQLSSSASQPIVSITPYIGFTSKVLTVFSRPRSSTQLLTARTLLFPLPIRLWSNCLLHPFLRSSGPRTTTIGLLFHHRPGVAKRVTCAIRSSTPRLVETSSFGSCGLSAPPSPPYVPFYPWMLSSVCLSDLCCCCLHFILLRLSRTEPMANQWLRPSYPLRLSRRRLACDNRHGMDCVRGDYNRRGLQLYASFACVWRYEARWFRHRKGMLLPPTAPRPPSPAAPAENV
jgi:hypothetical protein